MESIMDDFSQFLARQGLKLTRDRREILQAVLAMEEHFNIDDVFIRMRTDGSRIAKTTIYRALPLLIEGKVIQRVPAHGTNGKSEYYEQTHNRHHDHLVCLKCGRMVEFSSKKLEEAQTEACKKHDFEPMYHRVQIAGYCRGCR